jgi:hypothetical protein
MEGRAWINAGLIINVVGFAIGLIAFYPPDIFGIHPSANCPGGKHVESGINIRKIGP